jgi:hypothetical protein
MNGMLFAAMILTAEYVVLPGPEWVVHVGALQAVYDAGASARSPASPTAVPAPPQAWPIARPVPTVSVARRPAPVFFSKPVFIPRRQLQARPC